MNLWTLQFYRGYYSPDVTGVSEMSDTHSATQTCPQHWETNNCLPQWKGNIPFLSATTKSKTTIAMIY